MSTTYTEEQLQKLSREFKLSYEWVDSAWSTYRARLEPDKDLSVIWEWFVGELRDIAEQEKLYNPNEAAS